ncbi:MAG: hypothetical protein OQK04_16985, partial [Kangiellaceae bacterium]|nr:hypothetical protein [Kangiellaceae bacterium]
LKVQIDGIQDIITEGIANGEFASHGQSPKELASWVISCLQGAILTGRVEESEEPFKFAVNTIERYLNIT